MVLGGSIDAIFGVLVGMKFPGLGSVVLGIASCLDTLLGLHLLGDFVIPLGAAYFVVTTAPGLGTLTGTLAGSISGGLGWTLGKSNCRTRSIVFIVICTICIGIILWLDLETVASTQGEVEGWLLHKERISPSCC